MPILVPAPTLPAPLLIESTLTDTAVDYLPEYVTDADDGTLLALLKSVLSQADRVVAWMADPAATVDPWQAKADQLPWVAAVAGVDLTGVPLANQRAFIDTTITRFRGNEQAIRYRVGQTLTGAKSVEIVWTDWTTVTVTTYASQTPDATATTAAIKAELPAWVEATIVTNAAGQSYSAMASDYPTYGDMTSSGKTYGTLAQET